MSTTRRLAMTREAADAIRSVDRRRRYARAELTWRRMKLDNPQLRLRHPKATARLRHSRYRAVLFHYLRRGGPQ